MCSSLATVIFIVTIIITTLHIDTALALSPSGEIYVCLGQSLVFTCQVHGQPSSPQLDWRIHFEHSRSESDVLQSYISSDPPGQIQRDHRSGYSFAFNLTSSNSSFLVSTMMVTVAIDTNSSMMISPAIVNCGQESSEWAVLHVKLFDGPPTSPMNLTTSTQDGSGVITLLWSSSDVVDKHTIFVSPPIELGSIFTTPNTTVQLTVLYNQEYNISVVANNCAGNSAPTEIKINIDGPSMNALNYNVTGNTFSGVILTDQMGTSDGVSFTAIAYHENHNSRYFIIAGTIASAVAVLLIVLISGGVLLKKVHHQFESHQAGNYHPNLAEVNNLHCHNKSERLQNFGQGNGVIYADISQSDIQCTQRDVNLSFHPDLSLDDRVEYVEVKNPFESSECDNFKVCYHEADDLMDLDSLLIQLRLQVTPKWKEFGLVLGIAADSLEKYSSYPPEECIVEVLDYWLRSRDHHTSRTKPTWHDIAKALKEIELHQLAESILSIYETGQLPIQVDMNAIPENFPPPSVQSSGELPPLLPPKVGHPEKGMESATRVPFVNELLPE